MTMIHHDHPTATAVSHDDGLRVLVNTSSGELLLNAAEAHNLAAELVEAATRIAQ